MRTEPIVTSEQVVKNLGCALSGIPELHLCSSGSDISSGAIKLLKRTKPVRTNRYLHNKPAVQTRQRQRMPGLVAHCQTKRIANARLTRAVFHRPFQPAAMGPDQEVSLLSETEKPVGCLQSDHSSSFVDDPVWTSGCWGSRFRTVAGMRPCAPILWTGQRSKLLVLHDRQLPTALRWQRLQWLARPLSLKLSCDAKSKRLTSSSSRPNRNILEIREPQMSVR